MRKTIWMLLMTAAIVSFRPATAQNQSLEAQLQAAINKENVEGDLKGAIEQYRKIIETRGASRSVVARAMLQLGGCYEKQGNAEARVTFEKLLKEYHDQPKVVAQASLRLSRLGSIPADSANLLFRKVWTGPEIDIVGPPSPDGRSIAYIDKDTFDLCIRDLTTGSNRNLTQRDVKGREFEMALDAVWSPDGMRLAYSWCNKERNWELRVINEDGSDIRVVAAGRTLYGWFPDNRSILAVVKNQLRRIDVDSGLVQNLTISPRINQTRSAAAISPDGQYIAYESSKPEDRRDRDIFLVSANGGTATPIIAEKAIETLWGWDAAGQSVLFASDRSGSSGLWRIAITGGARRGEPELVKSGVADVPLGSTRDDSFFYRHSGSTWDVFTAEVDLDSGKIMKAPARANPSHIGSCTSSVWSPDGEYLAYMVGSPFGSIINILSVRGQTLKEFQTEFRFTNISHLVWDSDGKSLSTIVFAEPGKFSSLRLTVETGSVSILTQLQHIPMDWTPDATTIFSRGESSDSGTSTVVARNIQNGSERELYRSGEPVTFISLGKPLSPDGKWLAITSTPRKIMQISSQTLLVIPTDGGVAREVISYSQPQGIYSVGWSADSRNIIYSLRDEGQDRMQLWKIPLQGGPPKKLELTSPSIGSMSFHPDGRRITFTSWGTNPSEIWVLENLPSLKSVGK